MKNLFTYIRECYPKNTPFLIATVTKKTGSAPRGAGSHMLVDSKGLQYGTIGGGAIEYAAIQEAIQALNKKNNLTKKYILTEKDAMNLGMVCGGQNEIHFEYFESNDIFINMKSDEKKYIVYNTTKNTPCIIMDSERLQSFTEKNSLPKNWKRISCFTVENHGNIYFVQKMFLSSSIYIFGGGHVSRALAPILNYLNFNLCIIENRKEFLKSEDFPANSILHLMEYDNITDLNIDAEDYVCVMTRGHASDEVVVEQILKINPKYLGVIGSRRKTKLMKQKLLDKGFSKALVDSIHGPIGMDISAETPEEIAISIAGEIIKIKNTEV
ncbi:MAG: XdhC family protein [Tissierellia bacterium]|nr:XdhC family protein [Tissierellia bacterium]